MKISYLFYTLKDLSDIAKGNEFLYIMQQYGLVIDKASSYEPINKDFEVMNLVNMWKTNENGGMPSSCCFLFKGKKFTGMVSWHINLYPHTKAFNGIYLTLTVPKTYSTNSLIQLGDDIFIWSGAVYGFISEESKEASGNLHLGIPGLMWINYFGPEYTNESDFHTPSNHVFVGNGIRFNLVEIPNDKRLDDLAFIQSIKDEIGDLWFFKEPIKSNRRVPVFDKSEITIR